MLLDLNLETPDLAITIPQLIVFILAIVLLFADAYLPKALHFNALTTLSLVGYGAALLALFWQNGQNEATFQGVFRADSLTVFLSLVILTAAVFTVLVSASYVDRLEGRMPLGEYDILLAFSVLGALLVAASGNLVLIFVGIELSSLATYVLTAFAKRRATSLEAALKYFLLGMFASAILAYGMAWTYGVTGSTDLDQIAAVMQNHTAGREYDDPAILFGLLLLIVGVGFKMAVVPFHFWTPDAYDGAPTPVTGYMSVVPKAAAIAAAIRIFAQALRPLTDDWTILWAVLAFITIVFGNVVAVAQRNVKRMLAYSSIAHTGYMVVGLAAYSSDRLESENGISSVLYYILAYAFMNIGAFAVVTWLQHRGHGMTLDDFRGLASTSPLAALAMTVFLLSLMGMPPLIGFAAKYYVIVAAIESDLLWLAITIVVASAVSAYYYLRVIAVMYFNEPEKVPRKTATPLLNYGIAIMAAGTLLLGLFSADVLDLADNWTDALTLVNQVAHR